MRRSRALESFAVGSDGLRIHWWPQWAVRTVNLGRCSYGCRSEITQIATRHSQWVVSNYLSRLFSTLDQYSTDTSTLSSTFSNSMDHIGDYTRSCRECIGLLSSVRLVLVVWWSFPYGSQSGHFSLFRYPTLLLASYAIVNRLKKLLKPIKERSSVCIVGTLR